MSAIKEFHLFAGIGGGIYGGRILGHSCCGGVEIDPYAQSVLKQRQSDGWLEPFEIYPDVTQLDGKDFTGSFDILCGGFPCQAFSTAAHGKNIAAKNLWNHMLSFIKRSDAPVVFGENVVFRAIDGARRDLKDAGYRVTACRLSCKDLGADHQRNRFWLLAVKDNSTFERIHNHLSTLPKLQANCWTEDANSMEYPTEVSVRRNQLRGIGNAQSPLVCATAFRILADRMKRGDYSSLTVSQQELENVFSARTTWIMREYGLTGLHTPTTMANYHCASMMKHSSCQNFVKVFDTPQPLNGEYLMGFPIGASSPNPLPLDTMKKWELNLFQD